MSTHDGTDPKDKPWEGEQPIPVKAKTRWGSMLGKQVENPAIDAYIEELIAVGVRHNLSISHEDGHGSFQIEPRSESNDDWLRNASDSTGTPAP